MCVCRWWQLRKGWNGAKWVHSKGVGASGNRVPVIQVKVRLKEMCRERLKPWIIIHSIEFKKNRECAFIPWLKRDDFFFLKFSLWFFTSHCCTPTSSSRWCAGETTHLVRCGLTFLGFISSSSVSIPHSLYTSIHPPRAPFGVWLVICFFLLSLWNVNTVIPLLLTRFTSLFKTRRWSLRDIRRALLNACKKNLSSGIYEWHYSVFTGTYYSDKGATASAEIWCSMIS